MKKSQVNIIIAFLIVAFFLLINYLQPLRADDFGRAYTDALSKGFIIYLRGIGSNYFYWTGRISAQALIYLLLSKKYIHVSLFVINIINAVCFYIFILFSYKIVALKDKIELFSKGFLIYLFFFIFVFYQTGFIANVVWKTAAIQYFWGITLLTVFFYLSIIRNKKLIIFSLFTGLFIGLYNEIFVGVSILLCLAYFLDKKITNEIINKNIIYFFVACVIGGIILVAAPGNYVRLDSMSLDSQPSTFDSIINLVGQIILRTEYTQILLILLVIFVILIFSNKNVMKKRAVIYSFALILSVFVLTPVAKSYDINQRVLLIYYAIFFIATMQQFYNHSNKLIRGIYITLKKLNWLFLILLVLQLYLIVSIYFSIYSFEQYRDSLIVHYHQNNIQNPYLPMLGDFGPTVFIDDIGEDSEYYNNFAFAKFYDFETVVGEPIN